MYLRSFLDIVTPHIFLQTYAVPGSICEIGGDMCGEIEGIGMVRAHAGGLVGMPIETSKLKFGSVIDAMVIRSMRNWKPRGGSIGYLQTMQRFANRFIDILPPELEDSSVREIIALKAWYLRKLYNKILDFEQRNKEERVLPTLREKFRRWYGGVRGGDMMAALILQEDTQYVSTFLQPLDMDREWSAARHIAIPYFASGREVAAIEVVTSTRGSTMLWLTNHRIAFAGLLGAHAHDELFVVESSQEASRLMRSSTREPGVAYVAAAVQPEGTETGWIPRRVCYVQKDESDMDIPAELARAGSQVVLTRYPSLRASKATGMMRWGDAVAAHACHEFDIMGELSDTTMDYLRTVRDTRLVKLMVKRHLEASDSWRDVVKMDALLRGEIMYRDASRFIYASPADGYIYEDINSREYGGDAVTNFIVELLRRVVYENGDSFYTCRVKLRGEERYVTLEPKSFKNISVLTKHISKQITNTEAPSVLTPCVHDYDRARLVMPHICQQMRELPTQRGISHLGWNEDRTTFTGPDFIITKAGTEHAPVAFRPGETLLAYFDSKSETTPMSLSTDNVPDELMRIIVISAAFIKRSFLKQPAELVKYAENAATRRALTELFAWSGQNRVISVQKAAVNNTRVHHADGYPCCVRGASALWVRGFSQFGTFLLVNQRTHPNAPSLPAFDSRQYVAAGMLLRYVIEMLPAYLLKHGYTDEVIDKNLESEGWNVMRRCIMMPSLP